jgi:hypothetical protein
MEIGCGCGCGCGVFLPSLAPPPHRALREGGVAGVEEGLAPDGAAPSLSGVPDGWGDGDREMEMEMGM